MTNNATNSAIIDGLISGQVKERRLQDGGGENNLVEHWGVIGIHRLWIHAPFIAVNWSAMAPDVALHVGLLYAHSVPEIVIADDSHALVAPERLGVADFRLKFG